MKLLPGTHHRLELQSVEELYFVEETGGRTFSVDLWRALDRWRLEGQRVTKYPPWPELAWGQAFAARSRGRHTRKIYRWFEGVLLNWRTRVTRTYLTTCLSMQEDDQLINALENI